MVCNSGVSLIPEIDGKVLKFEERALYDGLFLMADLETESLWHHITGEALHGPMKGRQLPVGNLLHMTVEQLLALNTNAEIAISRHKSAEKRRRKGKKPRKKLSSMFEGTIADHDERRPKMEMGLGIWSGSTSRYYPIDIVDEGPFIDKFEGRNVAVYLDPISDVPAAAFVDSETISEGEDALLLDDGVQLLRGKLVAADGLTRNPQRPLQLFTRWYGFSLTFPDTEVYEAVKEQ